jgi:hypothetical protein
VTKLRSRKPSRSSAKCENKSGTKDPVIAAKKIEEGNSTGANRENGTGDLCSSVSCC